ncbi:hypothetical protein JCM8547_008675 [Rhodosporidiobolus lusitaniae]
MFRLPDELLEKIALHIEADSKKKKKSFRAQTALSRFTRTNKRVHLIVNRLLHARPRLSTPTTFKRFFRSYENLLSDPFTHAKSGFALPTVLSPFMMRVDFSGESDRLPPFNEFLEDLIPFRGLSCLSISNLRLTSNFHSFLLAPYGPARTTLLYLSLSFISHPADPEANLAFLLEAFSMPNSNEYDTAFYSFFSDDPEHPSSLVLPDDPDCTNEDVLEDSFDDAVLDFPTFRLLWEDPVFELSPWDRYPEFDHTFPSSRLFASLQYLRVAVCRAEALHLIICTFNFPSLHLRYAITRSEDDDQPSGLFQTPKDWDDDIYSKLGRAPQCVFEANGVLPPLCEREVQAYPYQPYNGLRLDFLTLTDANITVELGR